MSLKIAVCIKPVPDPKYYDKVTIDPVKKTITREGIPTIINPVDKNAIEAGLELRDKFGGTVIVITMAPPNAVDNLREALAMGADEAFLLSDRAFGGADTLATSYTLAQGLKKVGSFDLVLCGAESADGATAQVSSQLGEWLGVPHLWNVYEASTVDGAMFRMKTKMENGYMEWEAHTPFVLGVSRAMNKPRFTSAMGIIKSKKKPIAIWGKSDLTVDDALIGLGGSPTQAGGISSPDLSRKGEFYRGSAEEVVAAIMAKLRTGGISLDAFDIACEAGEG